MGKMNRRHFLEGTLAVSAALAGAGLRRSAIGADSSAEPVADSPRDVKINIKPLYAGMVHSGVWVGPCRPKDTKPPEEERASHKKRFPVEIENLRRTVGSAARVLEPIYYETDDYFDVRGSTDELFAKLDSEKEEVDLYLQFGSVGRCFAALVGERYKKPVAIPYTISGRELSAYLRGKKLEGYTPIDADELTSLIALLRARKVYRQTNILAIINHPQKIPRRLPNVITDYDYLEKEFGIRVHNADFDELAEEMRRVRESKPIVEQTQGLADKLIAAAVDSNIKREYVVADVEFYHAVKNLMGRHGCNAFSIDCYEICASRLSEKWKSVPCLTHSLLKDEGYPSACEGDLNALLIMDLLMALTKKAVYMGNLHIHSEEVFDINHSVPGLKMLGFDKPDLPYQLRYRIQQGWGTKLQIDFSKIEEKAVTIAQMNPWSNQILAVRGEVIGVDGMDEIYCNPGALISFFDAKGYFKKQDSYGHHGVMVYGDYTKELERLAGMLGMEIEVYHA
ncbi:MAG TPA: hypothetical protein VMY37_09680 [Thermoguttaceae bacterium]|nr:hypothetical protein [Thermoguttaceae bacterium]